MSVRTKSAISIKTYVSQKRQEEDPVERISHKQLQPGFRLLEQPAVEAVIENLNQKSSDDILNAVDNNDDDKKVADDARTVVTYVTEASTLVNQPLSSATATSSKLELQLDFLAKELELEKVRRTKLTSQIGELRSIIEKNKEQTRFEIRDLKDEKFARENAVVLDLDVSQPHLLAKGFVSLQ